MKPVWLLRQFAPLASGKTVQPTDNQFLDALQTRQILPNVIPKLAPCACTLHQPNGNKIPVIPNNATVHPVRIVQKFEETQPQRNAHPVLNSMVRSLIQAWIRRSANMARKAIDSPAINPMPASALPSAT